jgi:signal peptidase I
MQNKPRSKWKTAFLTLLTMGLGHIYCGEVKRGFIFFAIHYVLILLSFILLKLSPSLTSLATIAIVMLSYFIYCLTDALKVSRKKTHYYEMQKYNRWYVYVAVILIFLLIPRPLTRNYIKENVAKTFSIPTGSMIPTLLIGDMLVAKTDPISKSDINKGELVIFNYPKDRSRIFIKRVIATEGETLSIINKKVLVDDVVLEEPYIINSDPEIITNQSTPRDNLNSVKIPKGSMFVLGDNRDDSYDSRHWGFVKKSDIIGKAALLFWSWDSENYNVRWNRIGKILN